MPLSAPPQAVTPASSGFIPVGAGHELYFEERGDCDGIPVVVLHGGPGSGSKPLQSATFDPAFFRVLTFDQRGCGQSRPLGSLNENRTEALVGDIERLRVHLDVDKWIVSGGSWGSTLALSYASEFPDRCLGLILRGVFMARPRELAWFEAMRGFYPSEWSRFTSFVGTAEPRGIIDRYFRRLTSGSIADRCAAALEWKNFERACGSTRAKELDWTSDNPERTIAGSLIHVHYFKNEFFLPEGFDIRSVPRALAGASEIIHGRLDVVCPLETAVAVHEYLQGSVLQIVEGAGHTLEDNGIWQAVTRASNRLKRLRSHPVAEAAGASP